MFKNHLVEINKKQDIFIILKKKQKNSNALKFRLAKTRQKYFHHAKILSGIRHNSKHVMTSYSRLYSGFYAQRSSPSINQQLKFNYKNIFYEN